MTTSPTQPDPTEALTDVVRLLSRCAQLAFADGRPKSLLLGMGAQLVACQAVDLLPGDVDLDKPVPPGSDPIELLLAAERLTRAPIELFPPGTSQVIVGICDLMGENVP